MPRPENTHRMAFWNKSREEGEEAPPLEDMGDALRDAAETSPGAPGASDRGLDGFCTTTVLPRGVSSFLAIKEPAYCQ